MAAIDHGEASDFRMIVSGFLHFFIGKLNHKMATSKTYSERAIMKAKFFATATLLLATGAAFAQSALELQPAQQQKSTLTREQVKAEVLRARAAGELEANEYNYPPLPATASTLTREQVKAEVLAARANGELDVNEAQYNGFFDSRTSPRAQAAMTATAQAPKAAQ